MVPSQPSCTAHAPHGPEAVASILRQQAGGSGSGSGWRHERVCPSVPPAGRLSAYPHPAGTAHPDWMAWPGVWVVWASALVPRGWATPLVHTRTSTRTCTHSHSHTYLVHGTASAANGESLRRLHPIFRSATTSPVFAGYRGFIQ